MTTRTHTDALRWVEQGTALIADALDRMDDAELAERSGLPGWTRLHLLAHVSANAEALCNLVTWASTGVETPMYSSPSQRNDDIEIGSKLPAAELRTRFAESSQRLADGMAALDTEQWQRNVVTAQGRTVPASEIPWLRAREAMVHGTDFAAGVHFADLPEDFLRALIADIAVKRGGAAGPALALRATDGGDLGSIAGEGDPVTVEGPVSEVTAYLAGRPHGPLTVLGGTDLPALSAWL